MKVLILFFVFCVASSFTGDSLPGAVEGWLSSGRMLSFRGMDLFNYIDGGAELFLEFGFEELRVQRYQKGDDEISLEVYRMTGPEAALGIYLMKCGKETPDSSLVTRNTINPYQLTVVKGNCFILTSNFNGNVVNRPAMIALTEQVLAAIDAAEPVQLLNALPEPGLIRGSERILRGPYALQSIFTFGEGDVLQLRGKVFGVLGDYMNDKGDVFTRIIIFYPDTEAAVTAFHYLSNNLDAYSKILKIWTHGFIFKDYRNKFGIVQVENNVTDIKVNLSKYPAS